jgi:hypothetical protein
VAALAPAAQPLFAYIGRTPALSNAIAAVLGNNSPLVSHRSVILLHCVMACRQPPCSWLRVPDRLLSNHAGKDNSLRKKAGKIPELESLAPRMSWCQTFESLFSVALPKLQVDLNALTLKPQMARQ